MYTLKYYIKIFLTHLPHKVQVNIEPHGNYILFYLNFFVVSFFLNL